MSLIKIDRSFVHGAAHDPRLHAICSASVHMGKLLHMQVIAEGVEDQSDWNYLQQLGCDAGQGYFIGRPMPASDIAHWLADWTERRKLTDARRA